MLRWIYIILCILVSGYCIVKKRKCDIFTIYIFSSILYFFPMLIGEIQFLKYNDSSCSTYYHPGSIYYMSYIVLITNLTVCFIWLLVKDSRNGAPFNKKFRSCVLNQRQALIVILAEIITIGIALASIWNNRNILFSEAFDKSLLLKQSGNLDFITMKLAYILFVLAFCSETKYYKLIRFLGVLLIGYTLYMGSRSQIVMGIITICYIWLSKQLAIHSLWELVKKKKGFVLFVCLLIPAVFIIKELLPNMIAFDWEGLIDKLQNGTFI